VRSISAGLSPNLIKCDRNVVNFIRICGENASIFLIDLPVVAVHAIFAVDDL